MAGCLSCESGEAAELAAQYAALVGAIMRENHASAVVSLDADPALLDLSGTHEEIAANVAAALADVMEPCDAVLAICRGEEEPYDSDDIGAALTRRAPHPVCHVLKSATGSTGAAELQMSQEHRGKPPRALREKL